MDVIKATFQHHQPWYIVSRFGLAVRRSAGKQRDLGSNPLRLSFLFKKVVVCGHCLVTLSLTINETLKWLSSLPILLQWWQYSDRYIISPFPPFSPSLISLMVSVDVRHHVYLLCRGTELQERLNNTEVELDSHSWMDCLAAEFFPRQLFFGPCLCDFDPHSCWKNMLFVCLFVCFLLTFLSLFVLLPLTFWQQFAILPS